MVLDLRNGTRVRIRPIRPDDKPRLSAGLKRLSPEAVHARFHAPKPRFSRAELRYLTEVDQRHHIALVAEWADEPSEILAVARSIRLPERPDTAEMAIVVADELQGEGLGRALGLALADAARANGIRFFQAFTLGQNAAAQRLVSAISQRLAGDGQTSHGVREMLVELAA